MLLNFIRDMVLALLKPVDFRDLFISNFTRAVWPALITPFYFETLQVFKCLSSLPGRGLSSLLNHLLKSLELLVSSSFRHDS